nr:hypothetical protein [Tanacetum cinerariifolium]
MNHQLLDSQGPIPGMTPAQALTMIQTMADHSQKNVNTNSNIDGLAAIISKLDNLGRDMKKLKENVHAVQAGCQICEGPHHDKECALNEEVEQLEEVKYGEFGCSDPFNARTTNETPSSSAEECKVVNNDHEMQHRPISSRKLTDKEEWTTNDIQCQLPPKELNPRNFTLTCTI